MSATLGVYVLVDAFNLPLYVGASHDVDRRLSEHQRRGYWEIVASVEVYPLADWELALYVERNLIRKITPRLNTQSVDPVNRLMVDMFGIFAQMTIPSEQVER